MAKFVGENGLRHYTDKVKALIKNKTTDREGVKNGVAMLDGNTKIRDNQLWDATESKHGLMTSEDKKTCQELKQANESGALVDVPIFEEYNNDSVTLIENVTPSNGSGFVVFLSKMNRFVLCIIESGTGTRKYYKNWKEMRKEGFGNGTPESGSLYSLKDNSKPMLYIGNGTTITPVTQGAIESISNGEIDQLFVK